MAEPLKSFFSPALVRRLGATLAGVHPGFPVRAFERDATASLGERELLDRARLIAGALAKHLPGDYPAALGILLASLGPPHASDEFVGAGMAPFFYLPHVLFVAEHGLGHFDLSLDAQRELTRRFSAELSIRAYLARDPERTLRAMHAWARDPDPHVRRLASEGTRLRLPWAMRVPWLDQHPGRVLELLERLKDDGATLVRRSVANSLNDLGKVHPALLVETCAAWLGGATPERRALVEHALRSAVKRGESGALRLLGVGAAPRVRVTGVTFEPPRVRIGERVTVRFTLRSTARTAQALLVDLRVHFVGARGAGRPRVFKLARRSLPAGGEAALSKTLSLAVHTTRRPNPGAHRVEALVNGAALPLGAFEVVPARRAPARQEMPGNT